MSAIKYFLNKVKFELENGGNLPEYTLAYQSFGTLNQNKDNVIWIIHALTANSNPLEWWSEVVGHSKSIDPSNHFIICANVLGSHYGSTSPLEKNPSNGTPYYHDFPQLTIKDLAKTYEALANHLGLNKIQLLLGASMGGQQAMEWSILTKLKIENLLLIATNAKHSPYGIAFNESQRMAIEADQTWQLKSNNAGIQGMEVARSIALLSYRTSYGYNSTQFEENDNKTDAFKASSYQKYQGEKLSKRFNAYSYYLFTKVMDSHNVARGHKSINEALSYINSRTVIVSISSDILFTVEESKVLNKGIKNSKLIEISSDLGHDGFLTESIKINNIINEILSQ